MNLTLDFSESNGLVQCDRPDRAMNNYERLYLSELSHLPILPFAVFFRRYFKTKEDTTPYKSEPSVCIFEQEKVSINGAVHKKIHAALWSEGKTDIYIIQGRTRLEIFNARKPAQRTENGETTLDSNTLRLADSALNEVDTNRFSARLFGTGTFWEQKENQHYISVDNTPYKHLLDYLMEVRRNFYQANTEFHGETIDKLLVLSILVKFLEEKKDVRTERSTLDEIYEKYSIGSLENAVSQGRLLNVLDDLALEFNGKLFDQFSNSERELIQSANLSLLANFLSATIDVRTGQGFIWEQYSFAHLPAEVISAIYENFIQAEAERDGTGREKGVVYTPVHLVNFLVDEVMPLNVIPQSFEDKGIYKVLDPSCGSGVFLVAAYKRLLQWQAILNSEKAGTIAYPDKDRAQKILEDNIFGVEVKETAVLVTIFGLTTALLDYLTPKEVWNNLKFKDLREYNIIREAHPSGFFKWASEVKRDQLQFSLAIGNPPFNPEKGKSKMQVLNSEILNSLDFPFKIPRKNLALHFFESSMLLVEKICMIIPSNVLLYDKSKSAMKYRIDLFTNYLVSDIYDFTHLRRELFSGADTPVIALLADNKKSSGQRILHTVVKRTFSFERKIKFEIDRYDRHHVKWNWAIDPDKQFVWKTNLLGGGRLFHLIYKYSLLPRFKDFVKSRNWVYSVGYKLHGQDKKPNISYLQNKVVIETSTFDEKEDFDVFIETSRDFSEPRDKRIYEPPHLIYKVNIGERHIPIHYSEKFLGFKDKLVGIHAPEEDKHELKLIYERFKSEGFSRFMRLWILTTSSETLVNLETACKKEDIDSVPYPENQESLKLNSWEEIIQFDVLNNFIHLGKSISGLGAGRRLYEKASRSQLVLYGKVLCSQLNEIYTQQDNTWQLGKVYITPANTILQIGFGRKGELEHSFEEEIIDGILKSLVNDEISNRGAVFNRIVQFYSHVDGFDCVYFIKPNAYRYWLQSIALRDADETFADFQTKGY